MRKIQVSLVPEALDPDSDGVCAVVDVIRASTTLLTIAEASNSDIYIASSLQTAREAAHKLGPGALLCGERGGVAPDGFDHGNSPLEFQHVKTTERCFILSTTNGAFAIEHWSSARRTFIGTLRNASAVAQRLLDEDDSELITIVCAGRDGALALDDVYTAGVIVRRLSDANPRLELDETALLALHSVDGYPSAIEALANSQSAQLLKQVGLFIDVAYCAEVDTSTVVPELSPDGQLHIWPRSNGS